MNGTTSAPATGLDNAADPVIAVIGNPNTGKSTLFNALTGLRQKTANYPGVTVERHTGHINLDSQNVTLVDLPGAYSIAAQSPDEMVAIDVLLGHVEDLPRPRAILAVVDATNLRRNLFLVTQLAELGLPMVIGLNMTDLAAAKGIEIDIAALGAGLGAQVVALSAARGIGLDELRRALASGNQCAVTAATARAAHGQRSGSRTLATAACCRLASHRIRSRTGTHRCAWRGRASLRAERRRNLSRRNAGSARTTQRRQFAGRDGSDGPLRTDQRADRQRSRKRQPPRVTVSDRIDRVTNHPVIGSLLFLLVMACSFPGGVLLGRTADGPDRRLGLRVSANWCAMRCHPARSPACWSTA